jgi:signal transduction histidine kinase
MTHRGPAEATAGLHQAVLNALPTPVVVTDQEGRCLLANPAAARAAGVPLRELVGSRAADLPEASAARVLLHRMEGSVPATASSASHGPSDVELVGGWDGWRTNSVVVRSPTDGRPLCVTVARPAVGGLDEWWSIVAKIEAIRRFARRVAHDFNNFLAAILTTTELLDLDLAKGTPRAQDVAEIRDQARRAAGFARSLLAFGNEAASPVRVPALSLNSLVTGHVPTLRERLGPAIEVVTVLGEDVSPVRADPADVERILDALVTNAGRAMPDGGTLTIATSNAVLDADGGRRALLPTATRFVRLVVRDTGTGMDPATRERLFEPFFTTQESAPGAGFGLATVYCVVRACGGWIEGGGETGQGATFITYFPAAAPDVGAAPPETSHGEGDGEDPAGG